MVVCMIACLQCTLRPNDEQLLLVPILMRTEAVTGLYLW